MISRSLTTLLLVQAFIWETQSQGASSPFAWRFYLTENWTNHAQTQKESQVLATADCHPAGCQTAIYLNFSDIAAQPGKVTPTICFLFDQQITYCKDSWVEQNVGCPYGSCESHTAKTLTASETLSRQRYNSHNFFKTNLGYTWVVWDPWDSRWTTRQKGAMYMTPKTMWPSSRLYLWRSLVQIQTTLHATIQKQEKELNIQLSALTSPLPFSWLSLLRVGLLLANATGLGNLSACFFCAALGRPPLVAVPLTGPFNNSPTNSSGPFLLSGVPLFLSPGQTQVSFCYSNASTSLCNTTSSPNTTLFAPHGSFFWCNGTLHKNLSTQATKTLLCLPVTLVPQLTLRTPAEYLGWDNIWDSIPSPRTKRAICLPLVAGISLATSVVAAGLAGGAPGHSLLTTAKLSQQFSIAMEASAESLASLQRQLTSLAQVTLQNRCALDLLTAEKGGTCLFHKEECCFYINESGLVETRVQQLHKLSIELQQQKFTSAADSWWASSMYSLLMPLMGPLLSLLLLLTVGPCIISKIINFIKDRINTVQLMVLRAQYQPVMTTESV
ncbi:endogenous retrovirus group FC1 Env polyprotein-like [Piliocolobus tephrosceles]|uniref:endogenous retrovirus group FC1 Env polyprotein-like n=1 Tax=Piliocolobus tephrosceles TaxID=591936 RepID=UPI000E6B3BE9|nr:endogenous retrovirus group FC1 Env polyprotein-like [Piliocolobus tephrosceles]XP_026308177.1 endogenous retrovirus group FC1 Env polyprotein-like [Piliocolobus tephrosceles]XP_026308178.1 endogenous retrovirus group FC1 Env polyprotein-like [Piliocolobus tephrosceles]XP_026308179.1 endogenous retrovirus group FC1 Env polyprotein-like [Piliocolobus tephrosceles]XP_026308180.1 endogenous retrovirus group FC1 Env polyprotein-like [Piliocolobus tephrosceles]XP_026308181.1 endogenous retroviru